MRKPHTLKDLMNEELPNITSQKKLSYKPTIREVRQLYKMINEAVFYNKLIIPKIKLKTHFRNAWGTCEGEDKPFNPKRSRCVITLSDKWYCKQWLIVTLAHEMVHQYQWDIYSQIRKKRGKESLMSHGPSFFVFRNRLKKFDIPLKEASDTAKWFETQNLMKC